jgi:site-specific DNA-methyltransferase (adenine-specific)
MTPYYSDQWVSIVHGDCREVLPSLEPQSVTLLWTDPPYGHANQDGDLASARVGVRGARQRPAIAIANDGPEEMRAALDGALRLAVPLLRDDCCCCCCCCCGGGGPSPTFAWVADRMDREGLSFFHATIWDKTARGPGMGWRFRRDYEMVMVAHKRGGRLAWNEETPAVSNILRFHPERNILHPTTKPLSMVQSFIGWHTLPGDLVLDPFMGSGTTLQAAKSLGRRAIGIEIDERYCEVAANRCRQEVLELGA